MCVDGNAEEDAMEQVLSLNLSVCALNYDYYYQVKDITAFYPFDFSYIHFVPKECTHFLQVHLTH